MKIRSGVDIVQVSRMQKHADNKESTFVKRCFTDNEIEYSFKNNPQKTAEHLAARYAAKEAVGKALGTGVCTDKMTLTEIEILNDDLGAPYVVLHGEVLKLSERLKSKSISISLSHEKEYAIAYCSILTDEEE